MALESRIEINRIKNQNSEREARPLKSAYFSTKHVLTDSENVIYFFCLGKNLSIILMLLMQALQSILLVYDGMN